MAHHDKGKSKRKGSSCIMCKPHKSNSFKGSRDMQTVQEKKAREGSRRRATTTQGSQCIT